MQALTDKQRQELAESGELRLVDPQTRHEYVAIRAELYEKIKQSMCDMTEWAEDELEALAESTLGQLDNPERIR